MYHYYPDCCRRYRDYDYYPYDYRPYRYDVYDSQISNVDQNIFNSGYMSDVYQTSTINQIMDRRSYWR